MLSEWLVEEEEQVIPSEAEWCALWKYLSPFPGQKRGLPFLPSVMVGCDGSWTAEAAWPMLVETESPSPAVLSTSPCPWGAASAPAWDNCHRVICRCPATMPTADLGAYEVNRSSRSQWFRQPAMESCHTALPDMKALAVKQKKELIFF